LLSIERLESVTPGLRERRLPRPKGIDWNVVSQGLGTKLPSDYVQLAEYYPGIVLADFLFVTRPTPGAEQDFVASVRTNLEVLEDLRESDMTHGHEVFPQPGGLLGWGSSSDGDEFYWRTEGKTPDDWTVVVATANDDWSSHDCGVTEYLARLLSGTVQGHGLPPRIEEGGAAVRYLT